MKMEYSLVRSRRKTLSLEITPEGLIARAPLRMPKKEIDAFILSHADWIRKHELKLEKQQKAARSQGLLTDEEIRRLKREAKRVIPERVAYYAPKIGVSYGRISIRAQKTKWGSCSAEGNLNFNYLLMLAPPEVLDSVVVHELCHRKEMNHSPRFYAEVLRVFPEYKKHYRWLKDNGNVLHQRAGLHG